MYRKWQFWILAGVCLLGLIAVSIYAQSPVTQSCYSLSFGVDVRPEARRILDEQGYLVANLENAMRQTLNRHLEMTGQCFSGELGMIYNTQPRVFAVFRASLPDYGALYIMTEAQYYPEPFPTNSVGWQHSTDTELSAP